MTREEQLRARLTGLLLGTAVGDALGLPSEGLRPDRIRRLWNGEWRMRLVLGRGMISDDTEHAFLVGQSLLENPSDSIHFRRRLASRLRWWFLGLPAGIGMATARSCLKLWIGIPPEHSGVNSAGNGAAMRSALLGAFFAEDSGNRMRFVTASTLVTHADPKANTAAMAIAEAAAWSVREMGAADGSFIRHLRTLDFRDDWQQICGHLQAALDAGESVGAFATRLGLSQGVTGYAFHTVPVALYAWMRHPQDFRQALIETIECGGDTDTVGAIVGALVGCNVGEAGIPSEWMDQICDWPRNLETLRRQAGTLAQSAASGQSGQPVSYPWIGILPRNLAFLIIVLTHGFRRLFPPY